MPGLKRPSPEVTPAVFVETRLVSSPALATSIFEEMRLTARKPKWRKKLDVAVEVLVAIRPAIPTLQGLVGIVLMFHTHW